MKKLVSLVLALFLLGALWACGEENAVLEKAKTYEVSAGIHTLDIRIGAADFTIRHGTGFSVESDLQYLSVTEKDGVLTIVDEAPRGVTYKGPTFVLTIPADSVFKSISISTGAAKLTSAALAAESVKLLLGAGAVRIDSLQASDAASIQGGAGEITISAGQMQDLTLEMGVGELNMTAALLGNSRLVLGVGESNVTLLGAKDDYKVDLKKGLGSITVDGKKVSDFGSSGSGENHIKIEGGVGAVNLRFDEE